MRILIAEDQAISRLLLADYLHSWGHEVIETSNGAEALVHVNDSIDMLITDWSMPLMDGVELARQVRHHSKVSGYIYIILLTGRSDMKDMVQGFKEGEVDDYVVKPFEASELQLRIKVGERVINAEKSQRLYGQSLESIVSRQTVAIKRTQNEIINRLFSALECRDQETGSHVRRIGFISAFLGECLGWGSERVELLREAAPLHDVGKIGIPDGILRKPGPLSVSEYEIIKQHTLIGARILTDSQNPVIQLAEIIAKHHHENWDGSGYPSGLSHDEIPKEAMLVSVVDVYDALLSDRVYRKGLPLGDVLDFMRKQSGTKFDAEVVNLFCQNIHEINRQCQDAGLFAADEIYGQSDICSLIY